MSSTSKIPLAQPFKRPVYVPQPLPYRVRKLEKEGRYTSAGVLPEKGFAEQRLRRFDALDALKPLKECARPVQDGGTTDIPCEDLINLISAYDKLGLKDEAKSLRQFLVEPGKKLQVSPQEFLKLLEGAESILDTRISSSAKDIYRKLLDEVENPSVCDFADLEHKVSFATLNNKYLDAAFLNLVQAKFYADYPKVADIMMASRFHESGGSEGRVDSNVSKQSPVATALRDAAGNFQLGKNHYLYEKLTDLASSSDSDLRNKRVQALIDNLR